MLLGEPSETPADARFSLFGFPVRIHPLFWLVMAIFGLGLIDAHDGRGFLEQLLLWTIAAFLSVLLHEFGHAVVMRWFGYRPSITLYGFGGYASYNSSQMPGHWKQIFISAAGPGIQLFLAAAIAFILYYAGYGLSIYKWGPAYFALPMEGEVIYTGGLTLLLRDFMLASAIWAYLNLIPVYPMDGGRIARGTLTLLNPRDGMRLSLILSLVIGLGMVVVSFVNGDHFLAYFFMFMSLANLQALQQDAS